MNPYITTFYNAAHKTSVQAPDCKPAQLNPTGTAHQKRPAAKNLPNEPIANHHSPMNFKTIVFKRAHAEPALQEALAIALPHLSKAGRPLETSRGEHSAAFDVNVPGSNTTLYLDVEVASSYLPSTARITTLIHLSETADPAKSDSLFFTNLLVGDQVTGENAGPTLTAALAIADAVKQGADLMTARTAGRQAFEAATLIAKFGTNNKIRLNLPFHEKDPMKAKYPGRLLWNKDEKSWYYVGESLPEDLNGFHPIGT